MPKSALLLRRALQTCTAIVTLRTVAFPPYSLLFEKKARFPRTIEATDADFNALRPTETKSLSVILCDQSAGGQEHDSSAHC